ncbi:unannotated protein [freshwater metagenome]|uniref:Unannotated protein n=1 Tax=freshwater metagenome TaxID=449393 RepID=A0A6J6EAV9_9ZZZZ|nr:hypothetical protein [Actinomycetota bacterium]
MRIFRKGVNEEFDDSVYYVDDPVEYHAAENPAKNPLKFGVVTFISVLGIAFGANLLINVTSGNTIEFGQAIQVTAVCQGKTSPSKNMMLTPYAGFQNASGTGKFTLDSILLENVDRDCVGKDFTIKLFSNSSSDALTISETATSVGVYQGFQSFRFWWADSVTVTSMSRQYTDVELLNDTSDATDFNANESAFLITFDPDQVENFADAREVFKITIESNNHTN